MTKAIERYVKDIVSNKLVKGLLVKNVLWLKMVNNISFRLSVYSLKKVSARMEIYTKWSASTFYLLAFFTHFLFSVFKIFFALHFVYISIRALTFFIR